MTSVYLHKNATHNGRIKTTKGLKLNLVTPIETQVKKLTGTIKAGLHPIVLISRRKYLKAQFHKPHQ